MFLERERVKNEKGWKGFIFLFIFPCEVLRFGHLIYNRIHAFTSKAPRKNPRPAFDPLASLILFGRSPRDKGSEKSKVFISSIKKKKIP